LTSGRFDRLAGLRGFPPLFGFLRQSQVDSGAGSARDEKKPAVYDANTVNKTCRFAGI
jgi:hypothetical protein